MPRWRARLEIAHIWRNDELSFEEQRDQVVRLIREAPFYDEEDDELVDIVDNLKEATNWPEWNDWWELFYDWCDDGHKVWVNIF